MATLTLIPTGDIGVATWSSEGSAPFFDSIDDYSGGGSHDSDTTFLAGPNNGSNASRFALTDFPGGFDPSTITAIDVTAAYRKESAGVSGTADTIGLSVFLRKTGGSPSLTNDVVMATNIGTTYVESTTAASGIDTAASLADWNAAELWISQVYTQNGCADTTTKLRLSAIKIVVTYSAPTAHEVNPSDSLTLADAVSTQPNPNIADSLTLADAASTQANPSPADTLALSDAIASKAPSLVAVDNLALSDAVSVQLNVAAADSLNLNDAVAAGLSFDRTPSDNLSLADAVTPSEGHGVEVNDNLSLADAASKAPSVSSADNLSLTDAASKSPSVAASDNLPLADAASKSPSVAADDALALSDAASKAPSVVAADTLALNDAVARQVSVLVADNLALADAVASSVQKFAADTIDLSDSASLETAFHRVLADALDLSDSVTPELTGSGSALEVVVNDTLALADAVLLEARIEKADVLSLDDSASTASGIQRAVADVLAMSDLVDASVSIMITLGDVLSLADAVVGVDLVEILVDRLSNILMPFPCPVDGGKMYEVGDDATHPAPASVTGRVHRIGRVRSRCISCGFEMEQFLDRP